MPLRRSELVAALWLVAACGDDDDDSSPGRDAGAGHDAGGDLDAGADEDGGPEPGWFVAFEEDFEGPSIPEVSWREDEVPDDGPFADGGEFFTDRGVTPPAAFRATAPFGESGWLTAELYSRSAGTAFGDLVAVVDDPGGSANRVLRLSTPAHTDGAVVRPTESLPDRYRISVRVGWADYGDGLPGSDNGYDGGNESAAPWLDADATEENGFYWLAILDAMPRPHNNVWIHHHRKVVIDSDNHDPPWMEIWDGSQFVDSGERPIMMFALDGRSEGDEWTGKRFLPWSAGAWQPSGTVRAVDRYLPERWYRVTIERDGDRFTLAIEGELEHAGEATVTATLDAAAECVWHFNQTPEAGAPCVDEGFYAALDERFPHWPAGASWPDWFMFGDPHSNYYEGLVHYDDVKLELMR